MSRNADEGMKVEMTDNARGGETMGEGRGVETMENGRVAGVFVKLGPPPSPWENGDHSRWVDCRGWRTRGSNHS